MKRTITGMALVLALVFTTAAWSQDSPMKGGKMGMGKMDMGESSKMKACMQMMGKMDIGDMEMSDMDMGEMETTSAAVDGLLGRMQAADGGEKMAAMEELVAALVAQQREMQKMMRGMPKMMCGGMMRMMMQ